MRAALVIMLLAGVAVAALLRLPFADAPSEPSGRRGGSFADRSGKTASHDRTAQRMEVESEEDGGAPSLDQEPSAEGVQPELKQAFQPPPELAAVLGKAHYRHLRRLAQDRSGIELPEFTDLTAEDLAALSKVRQAFKHQTDELMQQRSQLMTAIGMERLTQPGESAPLDKVVQDEDLTWKLYVDAVASTLR